MPQSTKHYQNFNTYNTIDLTTAKASSEEPCYTIDARLLNTLLKRVTEGSVDDIKRNMIAHITHASTKEEIFENVSEYIYLNEIAVVAIEARSDREGAVKNATY